MVGFEGAQRIPISFATAATLSSAVACRGWNHVNIEVPTFAAYVEAASTCLYVQVAENAADTFRRVKVDGTYSAGAGILDWEVPAFTGDRTILCWPAPQFNFIKVELLNPTTAPMTCWVHLHN